MTKEGALYLFWSSFGLTAYEENTVPTGEDAPKFPYLTYSVSTDEMGREIALNTSLWYRSDSWVEINAKTEDIAEKIGRGGYLVHFDGGSIWIKKGQPFAQNMGDESDDMIRRKYLNILAEYLSAD